MSISFFGVDPDIPGLIAAMSAGPIIDNPLPPPKMDRDRPATHLAPHHHQQHPSQESTKHPKQTRSIHWMKLIWLVWIHVAELVLSKRIITSSLEQQPVLLDEAIYGDDCSWIYAHAVALFRESPRIDNRLQRYLNSGLYVEECLVGILDAYFEQVVRVEWRKTDTPVEYEGQLAKLATIPDTFYPLPSAGSDNHSGLNSSFRIQVAGQSKSFVSVPFLYTVAEDTKPATTLVHWNVGEDAAGISKDWQLFIVADGVGGASQSETVSRSLTYLTMRLYEEGLLKDILAASDKLIPTLQLFINRFVLTGSTTFLVVQLADRSTLSVLNIGDCGVMLVDKHDNIRLLTEEQWYAPNTPFQLNSHSELFRPTMAARYRTSDLQPGDRLLIFSDGIGDNVWPLQLARMQSAEQVLRVARAQAQGAIGANIPFSRKMNTNTAGKLDDMTVIMVNIRQ